MSKHQTAMFLELVILFSFLLLFALSTVIRWYRQAAWERRYLPYLIKKLNALAHFLGKHRPDWETVVLTDTMYDKGMRELLVSIPGFQLHMRVDTKIRKARIRWMRNERFGCVDQPQGHWLQRRKLLRPLRILIAQLEDLPGRPWSVAR